ncbi:MAG: NHL repeat-containing protein [Thermincolia bacterium]
MRIKTLISLVLIIVIVSLAFGVIFSRQIEPPTQQAQKPLQQPVYLYSLGGAGGSSGALNQPMAVIRHPDGNIYVADMGHRQVKVYFPNGSWAFSFGQGGEGTGKFTYPYGLAVLDNGDLLVGDPANGTIQRFTKRGVFVKEIIKKEQGLKPGLMTRAPQDKVLVADLRQHQLVLIDKKGKIIKKIGQQAGLKFPQGLVIVEQENIWVADAGNFVLKLIDNKGRLQKTWTTFKAPQVKNMVRGLEVDGLDRLMVTDPLMGLVRVLDQKGREIFTFGQQPGTRGLPLSFPMGLHVDNTGKIYIADRGNNMVQVWGYPDGSLQKEER